MNDEFDDCVTDVIAKELKMKFKDLEHLLCWCGNLDKDAIPLKIQKDIVAHYDVAKYITEFVKERIKCDGCDVKTNFHLDQTSGRLIVGVSIEYKIDLGLCWTCYDCGRTFTDQKVAWMRSVGGHYQERTVYSCEECVSYWYGRKNYGKEKPDYLDPEKEEEK